MFSCCLSVCVCVHHAYMFTWRHSPSSLPSTSSCNYFANYFYFVETVILLPDFWHVKVSPKNGKNDNN